MRVESHLNELFSSMSYFYKGALIDPGDKWERFNNVKVVLLTHAHFDHIYGLNELFHDSKNIKVYTNEKGKEMLLNARKNLSFYNGAPFVFDYPEYIVVIDDGEEVEIDNGIFAKAIYTPGHNPSCVTWIIENNIFSGDSYIPCIKTVTNLPNGNRAQAISSEQIILRLSLQRTIFPGHGIHSK